jgi:uncharacterized membrane protein YcaP (DUF421 family)
MFVILEEAMRKSQAIDPSDVAIAMLETNGEITVIKNGE